MKKTDDYNVGTRKPFVKNLLLVEGISRSGKFLLANILSGISGVEPVQYYGLLEQLPVWEKLDLVDTRLAKEILQCEVDTHAYEMFIGRNLNYRKSDKSSIYNVPNTKKYIERCDEEDGQSAKERYDNLNPYSMFIMHELAPNLELYLDTFPELKIVHIERNPISLVYSWWKRGLGSRYGEDTILFQIVFESKNGVVPWYAQDWEDEYLKLSEIDRVIKSIETLQNKERLALETLTKKDKEKVLTITYEQILCDTDDVVLQLSKFLNREVTNSMSTILEQESLPNEEDTNLERDRKLKEISSVASDNFVEKLLEVERIYLKNK